MRIMAAEKKLTIPIAIIIAGALIAGAVFFVNQNGDTRGSATDNENGPATGSAQPRPLSEDDHVLGNPNADILIIEYSDTECPFCKEFHNTMHTIIDEYGREGKVAWVYRHFPIEQLHSKAPKEAEALECAAELGGNDGFWAYTDRLYEVTPSNNGLDLDELPKIAEDTGLDRDAFERCLSSGRHRERVQRDFDDAVAVGGRGTPHSLIVAGGQIFPVAGAQPLPNLRSAVESILTQLEEGTLAPTENN